MGKIILVTGGAGFIGSHICNSLFKNNNKVICVDNLTTGNENNIKSLLQNENFEFIPGSISDRDFVADLKRYDIGQIYHLASPASVTYITEHPVEAALANSVGTKNLLDLARNQRAKLLFASSSESYGDPKEHPQKESYWGNVNSVGIRSGYDEGKRFGEALCMGYKREYDIDVKIVRIFNTYGPNSSVDDSRVIPSFIVSALRNNPLPVHGDGTQTRSFCYVNDMVDGIIAMMQSQETGPINLGNPEEFKIINIARIIQKATNTKSEITFIKRPKDDPSIRKPDITLAKEKLGWEPKIQFSQGLQMTIDYFRKRLM